MPSFRFIIVRSVLALALAVLATPAYAGLVEDYNANSNNRCGDNVIPQADCPAYQEAGYRGARDAAGRVVVAACIGEAEYNFARAHSLAPQCSSVIMGKYVGWCRCGCFERGTTILAVDHAKGTADWRTVESIDARRDAQDAVTLTEDATLEDIAFVTHGIEATTVGAEEKPLVVLHTENELRLGLTERHAVLLADGRMVAAVDIEAGDEVVSQTGRAVLIDRIERLSTDDKVFNLLTEAPVSDKSGHLVVANGLIVGDLVWQNTLANELSKIAVRR